MASQTRALPARDDIRREGAGRQIKMLAALVRSEWQLLVREPSAFFFTLVFPILLVLLFGAIFGNDPKDGIDGHGSMDLQVPAYCVLIIGTLALFNVPIQLSQYRETGVLRRFHVAPVRAWMIFASQLIVGVLVVALGTVLMMLIGKVLYGLHWPQAPFGVALGLLIGTVGFSAVGFLMAAVLGTSRQVQLVANILYFPQLFLSGTSFPRELFPHWLRVVSEWLPLTQVVLMIQSLWFGDGWRPVSLLYLAIIFVVGYGLAIRLFRWDR